MKRVESMWKDSETHRSPETPHLLSRVLNKGASALIFAAALCASTTASAHTSAQVEMTCPYDGTKFLFEAQTSGTAFGTTLDFMPVGAIQSPQPIAVCPTNGFVFFKDKFDDQELERLRPLILSPDYQALKEETPYYRAAWIGEHTGAPHAQVSVMLLQATWEAFRDPRRYSRYATELAARLPEDVETSKPDQKRMFQLLQGEIMRRLGKLDDAKQYFQKWSKELEPTGNDAVITAFEIKLIEERDTQPHLMAEAVQTIEKDPATWLARRTPTLSGKKILEQAHTFKFDRYRGGDAHWMQDGRLIGRNETQLELFDLSNNTIKVIESSDPWSYTAAFSQDGKNVVFETSKGSWRLAQMDTFSFKEQHSVQVPGPGTQKIVMAYDGKSALIELDNGLKAFDLGSDTLRPLPSPVFSQGNWWLEASDPTGPRIVLNHEDGIVIWNYAEAKAEHLLQPQGWIKSMAPIFAAYSHDGKTLFVAADTYWDGECELTAWDSVTGAQLSRKRVKGGPGARLAVSPNDRLVGLACGKSLYLWSSDLTDPPIETAEASGTSEFREIAFSPNSKNLAVELDDALIVYAIAP
jgi:WD40 repeat protein